PSLADYVRGRRPPGRRPPRRANVADVAGRQDRCQAREGRVPVEAFMPRDRFVRHLQGVDVMVIPLLEGAANCGLFEAMVAGVPPSASRRCFVAGAITDGREAGFATSGTSGDSRGPRST